MQLNVSVKTVAILNVFEGSNLVEQTNELTAILSGLHPGTSYDISVSTTMSCVSLTRMAALAVDVFKCVLVNV